MQMNENFLILNVEKFYQQQHIDTVKLPQASTQNESIN